MQINNLPEIITLNHNKANAFNYLKSGKWHSISNQDFCLHIEKITLALNHIGLKKNHSFGIIANSSPFWLMFNFAAMNVGGFSVPIFTNISQENLLFQIDNAQIEFFFCDCPENLETLLKSGQKFKKIITLGFKHHKKQENIITFTELLKIGDKIHKQNPKKYQILCKKIKKDDIATIIYTSGSTGIPKGVEITHQNLLSQIQDCQQLFNLNNNDKALSFLPLAHIFEGMVICFYISQGVAIYFADEPKNVGNLLKEVKPTLMTVVPRLLEKTYNKMQQKANESGFFSKNIAKLAFKVALKTAPQQQQILKKVFDKLVYQKLNLALGGNLRMMICGGAPLSKNLEQFYNNIGINIFVGYGLTETSPVIATNCPKFNKIGTVGKKLPNMQVKISNGELLAKGPSIMKGYHNNPNKTKEIINKDGWLKTGDLAKIDNEGYITITGRKKELFKTATGKYVCPIPIEQQILENCPILSGALVIAENKKFTSCLLFADFDNINTHKKQLKLEHLNNQDFLQHGKTKEIIDKTIDKVNKNLNYWEQIKKFQLINDEISIKNGDITPSMKLKRDHLEKKYLNIIEKFYQN